MDRFLCDQMLAGLGKWLRAAGYDTAIVETSIQDSEVLKLALQEQRRLITRDKHFLEMDAPEHSIIYLQCNTLEECVQKLNHICKVNWLYRPFSRCLECNSLVEKVDPQMVSVPPRVLANTKEFWVCKGCKKVYWEGTHTEQMLNQLQKWQESI